MTAKKRDALGGFQRGKKAGHIERLRNKNGIRPQSNWKVKDNGVTLSEFRETLFPV
jgi:hypothetical protein